MLTTIDIKRLQLPKLTPDQIRRINNAEVTCKNATTDWAKNYWYNVFAKHYVRNMVVMTISERLYTNEYILC